ncbi:MAG: hypothetical protein ABIH34_02630 [Nanoarchaeota archaeon]
MDDFARMHKEMEQYDATRELLIKQGRDVLKAAKKMIYALHRNETISIAKLLSAKKALDAIAKKHEGLRYEGSYSSALEEFVEAMCYHAFVHHKPLPPAIELGVNAEVYLMGICDLTGELSRRAVRSATAKNLNEVKRIASFLDDLEGELIRFDFRNGNLRKKYDAVKWNLKKVEEILYDTQ